MRLRHATLCVASVAALLLAGTPAAAAPHAYMVVIDKLKFGPLPSVVHRGDTIVWVNHDLFRHTATAADHSFDVDLQPGAKAATVMKSTGAIAFVCRYHPNMRGVLVVK